MYTKVLKAKVHLARVTGKNLLYEGSLSLDKDLMDLAGLKPFEAVWIYNLENGERFETYLIPGKKGEVALNGAAARLGEVGDRIIIASYVWLSEEELKNFKVKLVFVDEKNNLKNLKEESIY